MDYMQELGTLSLGSRLKRLSDRLINEVNHVYQTMGLSLNVSYGYFPLLNLINRKGPQTVTQASELLGVSHPAVSKLAKKMLKDGYLTKQAHPQDKRTTQLSLTDKSQQLIQQATPIWAVLKETLDEIEAQQKTPLLSALDDFEANINNLNYAQTVLNKLQNSHPNICIENWHPQYKADFKALNMNWLNSEFDGQLTTRDKQSLNQPEQYYLSHGGYIYFAKAQDKVVGTVALKLTKTGLEISKMAVLPEYQGKGIGRKLLLHSIQKARELQIGKIWLESNDKLTRAMTLYQHLGFSEQPHPQGKSDYARANVYMVLPLSEGDNG